MGISVDSIISKYDLSDIPSSTSKNASGITVDMVSQDKLKPTSDHLVKEQAVSSAITQQIENKCNDKKINFNKFFDKVLKSQNLTKEQYETLPESKKSVILQNISEEINNNASSNLEETVIKQSGDMFKNICKSNKKNHCKDMTLSEMMEGYDANITIDGMTKADFNKRKHGFSEQYITDWENRHRQRMDALASTAVKTTKGREQALIAMKHSATSVGGMQKLADAHADFNGIDADTYTEAKAYRYKNGTYDENDDKEAALILGSKQDSEHFNKFTDDSAEIRKQNKYGLPDKIYESTDIGHRMGLNFNEKMTPDELEKAIKHWETTQSQFYSEEDFKILKEKISQEIKEYEKAHFGEVISRSEEIDAVMSAKGVILGSYNNPSALSPSDGTTTSELSYNKIVFGNLDETQQKLLSIPFKYLHVGLNRDNTELKTISTSSISLISTLIDNYGFDVVANSSIGKKKATLAVMTNPALANQISYIPDNIHLFDKKELANINFTSPALLKTLWCLPVQSSKYLAGKVSKAAPGYNQKRIAENELRDIKDGKEQEQLIA